MIKIQISLISYLKRSEEISILEAIIKMKQLVNSFVLSENTLKEIIFFHNAVNLNNLEPNLTLKAQKIRNNDRIKVMDINYIIGA